MDFTDAGTSVLGLKESFEGLTDAAQINSVSLVSAMRKAGQKYGQRCRSDEGRK